MKPGKCLLRYGVVAALVTLVGCKGGHEEKVDALLPVARVGVQEVVETGVGSRVEVAGTIQAVERALITSRVNGQIARMPVVVGSLVQKGDLLVQLNAAELTARVQQARARLEEVNRNLAREERLFGQGASTQEAVRSLRDQLRIAQAVEREGATMLDYATITAPFTGTVTRKFASVGDLAAPGVALLELESSSGLQVEAQVPERLVLRMNKGERLPILIPAAGLRVEGTVVEISAAADPVSRTTLVKLDLEPGADLRSGQFARVMLPGLEEKTLLVGETAIQPFGQMERVFLMEESGADGKRIARLSLVRTGARYNGQVEILAGLNPGDRVVVAGGEKLKDGQPLEVITENVGPQDRDVPVPSAPGMEKGRPQDRDVPVPSAPGMEKGRP